MTKQFKVGDVVRVFPPDIRDRPIDVLYGDKAYINRIDLGYGELVSREGYELSLVEKARLFARTRHHGQFRRSKYGENLTDRDFHGNLFKDDPALEPKIPYFAHCEKVAELVDTDFEKAVAYCHDLIEDGKATEEEISKNVGEEISGGVVDVTHFKEQEYFDYIKDFIGYRELIRIKIADIVANLSDSPTWEQIEKYNKALRILAGA